ncbi:MAG: PhzF family phenazine biosynthesis protein [Actinomycetota bacterium]
MESGQADLRVLRVFTAADGTGGNPLGVHLVGAAVPPARRQAEAARLGFSETVFVDDREEGVVEIRTPTTALPFAGHPLVGTAWLLAREGAEPSRLRPPAGAVPTWAEGPRRWIRGRAAWAPPMELLAYASPAEVDRLEGPPPGVGFAYCWAYLDEGRGLVRARAFAEEAGIAEDEATGSAAVRLAAALDRPLTIRQGRGSELRARPGPDGTTEVGGLVAWA